MQHVAEEKKYETVYGDTFALYSNKDMEDFMEPFEVRFRRNGLDASRLFQGKKCFDAGCGNGRGALFMLRHGASHVTAYDFSSKNVETTEKFTKHFGFSNVRCVQGSLESIPFEGESFDFVWCNGVIMHTGKPDKCLSEVARILGVGGNLWLYVYGAGGAYWRVIFRIRSLVKAIPPEACIAALRLLRYEPRYVAEFIDDWYASFLRTYTDADLSPRLMELGFEKPTLLKYGMDYDTSHRLNSFPGSREAELMGEGDLRYLVTKRSKEASVSRVPISDGPQGSRYAWPSVIASEIDPLFEEFDRISAGTPWLRIAAASRIQRELRLLLTETKPFPFEELKSLLQETLSLARSANSQKLGA